MAPYVLENGFEHWSCQASSLGILLTWVIGGDEDFAIGKWICMTMSELHLVRRLCLTKGGLEESMKGDLP